MTIVEKNKAFIPFETHYLNDDEVKKAQEKEFPEEYQLSSDLKIGSFSAIRVYCTLLPEPSLQLPALLPKIHATIFLLVGHHM